MNDEWNYRKKIAVLMGGSSAEREVSLKSGEAVSRALRANDHQVTQVDPQETPVQNIDWSKFDLAFIALHGTYGEDGGVQQDLDELQVLYTGSDSVVSQLAFNKHETKTRLRQAGLLTPDWCLTTNNVPLDLGELKLPVVTKPNCQGSSVGVSFILEDNQLQTGIEHALHFGDEVLIETMIRGEEWTLPIMDQTPLPTIRIRPARDFYDYTAKYEDDRTGYEPITDPKNEIAKRVSEAGSKACELLGTQGICRVDIMVAESGTPWILEVNTIPGMTDHSLVPKSAAAIGWDMSELCERAVQSAISTRTR